MHTNSRKNLQKQEEKRREDESDQRQSEHQFRGSSLFDQQCLCSGKQRGGRSLGKLFDMVNQDDLFGAKHGRRQRVPCRKKHVYWHLEKHIWMQSMCAICMAETSASGNRHFHGSGRITDSHVRIVRSLFHIRRSTCSFCYERGSWVWGIYAGSDFQHFGSAEKEFRFPLGYASQRPLSASWTVTGSGAFLVGRQKSHVRITGVTVGKIVDYGLKDSQNMGACMAPAAADTILTNLKDFGRSPTSYDRIITGDLGYIGQSILLDL